MDRSWVGLLGGAGALALGFVLLAGFGGSQARVWLSRLVVGYDNRVSTSQCVVLAWTLVLAYLLGSMLIARWAGTAEGWNALRSQVEEPYLVLVGGPLAAHLWARGRAARGGKTLSMVSPSALQLISDDNAVPDLPDFQYVLFNGIVMLFVLVQFIGHLEDGLPYISPAIYALTLVSAGGYSLNKLIAPAAVDEAPRVPEVSATEVARITVSARAPMRSVIDS